MNRLSKKRVQCKRKIQQGKFAEKRLGSPTRIKQILKLMVVEWHCKGLLPASAVSAIFKILKLKEV